jgi:hypothetical protein
MACFITFATTYSMKQEEFLEHLQLQPLRTYLPAVVK